MPSSITATYTIRSGVSYEAEWEGNAATPRIDARFVSSRLRPCGEVGRLFELISTAQVAINDDGCDGVVWSWRRLRLEVLGSTMHSGIVPQKSVCMAEAI